MKTTSVTWYDEVRQAVFMAPLPATRPRTAAADRTRSARWRAGSRRTRRFARPRPVPRDPWARWEDAGYIDETVDEPYLADAR